jgi:uncharacterized protein YkwD
VLELVNTERTNRGLEPLLWDYDLAYIAHSHSMDMAHRGFFYHICPDGLGLRDRMINAGIIFWSAAENIAAGQRTAEEVVAAWMNSPGHRANILRENYTHIGVGLYIGGEHGYYWTKKFAAIPDMPDIAAFERRVLELTNIERAKHGLRALIWDDELADAARAHSTDMSHRTYFDHICPDGLTPFDRKSNAGISYLTAAENLAAGQRTPEEVVEAWMNSPGHRAAILNADLTHLGVGLYVSSEYRYYWTQKFKG